MLDQDQQEVDIKALFKLSEKVSKVCRLFAEENINVQFEAKAETACFYPSTRVMVFPYNMTMMSDDDIMILFLTHETGHAFWSTPEYLEKSQDFHTYHNIVEDIRIERMIKDKYPGLVASYVRGYRKLYSTGFFGQIKNHPFMSFANRLNILAKCGPTTAKNVTLNQEESEFYHRCMEAKTEDDVLALAKELSEMQKSSIETIQGLMKSEIEDLIDQDDIDSVIDEPEDEDDGDEWSDGDGSSDSPGYGGSDESKKSIHDLTEEEYQRLLEAIADRVDAMNTDEALKKKIAESNVVGASFVNYETVPFRVKTPDISNYVDGLKASNRIYPSSINAVRTFLGSLNKSVAYMAREFEIKKAAARQKNSRISNTGQINLNRACMYKVSDDIFGKKVTFKDDKRHGMFILVDGSGSISRQFGGMAKQVLLLCEYARKIGVPFSVWIFGADTSYYPRTDVYTGSMNHYSSRMVHSKFRKDQTEGQMFEVLNSELNSSDYNIAAYGFMNQIGFRLGSTPTGMAMHVVEQRANEFYAKHNCDIKKLFILTDGEPTDCYHINSKTLVVDPLTKKTYRCDGPVRYTPVSMMASIFKDRYKIDTITLFVTSQIKYGLASFMNSGSAAYHIATSNGDFRRLKYVETVDTMGHPLFAIRPTESDTEIELEIDAGASQAKMASAFAKSMKKFQISQSLLQAMSSQFAA